MPRVRSFLLCPTKAKTDDSQGRLYTYVNFLKHLSGLCVFLSFFHGEAHGPSALLRRADTTFVWHMQRGAVPATMKLGTTSCCPQVLLGNPGGRRLALSLSLPDCAWTRTGPTFLAQGLVAYSPQWLPFALASWARGRSVVICS